MFEKPIIREILALLFGGVLAVLLTFIFLSVYSPDESNSITETFSSESKSANKGVFHNYSEGVSSEVALFSSLKRPDQITLFGSSEFNDGPMVSYNFLPNNYGLAAVGFGHAFHQNFSIYCELLAGKEYLSNSKIVLFISPGWFETEGTNSESFLEFVPSHFLEKIWADESIAMEAKAEIGRYINENRTNFNGLTKQMQNFQDLYLAINTISPGKKLKMKLTKAYPNLSKTKSILYELNDNPISKKSPNRSLQFMKDSLSKMFLKTCTNNEMFIDSTYFKDNLINEDGTNKTGSVNEIALSMNREFKDFLLVMELLKRQKADVSVVIQGLNPYYYTNLSVQNSLISSVKNELTKRKIPFLNLFTSDINKYQPGILSDVMHLGDLGWLNVNEFILKTYSK